MTTKKENLVSIKPKTIEQIGFVYNGTEDLPNLIKFVGKSPTLEISKTTGQLEVCYRKTVIKEGTVVFRNSFGEVTHTLTPEQIAEKFEVVAYLEFKPENANVIQEKVKVIPEKKQKEAKK